MKARRKILIVDDNSANLTTCRAILRDTYDVYTALSAASMFSLLDNITPDLIMLDVKMPEIDGYEAAKMLKRSEQYKDIPIIFVSALNDVESEMEGLELGAVDFITKPYFPPILMRRIETHLDLLEKTKQLERSSQAKTNFLTNMSHEMRSPLTVVLGLTELTLDTVHLDDETYSNLLKVYRAGDTLLGIINDILDISKIEADKVSLNNVQYNLPSMLSDAITQSILYIESKPIEFELHISQDLPQYLRGDDLRVKQIITNLLSNAFKYTRKGRVELGVKCDRQQDGKSVWLTAWVQDTGIGIREENIWRLFDAYSRMEEDESAKIETNRRTEGTGLGLAISKRIAEMMGGSITVESEYGKGSLFKVRVRQECVSDDVIGPKAAQNLRNHHFHTDRLKATNNTRLNMSYARVLVVDDNATNLDVIKSLMHLYGMQIDCVTSARQAIDAIREAKPLYDAIFMDHLMPDIDGIEATRIIREKIGSTYARTIPIIALTANAVVGNEEMFLSKGFQAFIPKPIDLSLLDAVLRTWVRNKDAEALLPNKTITVAMKETVQRVLLEDIDGVDIDKGMLRYNMGENAYIELLHSFATNTASILDALRGFDENDPEKYITTVHGIKGSSRGVFATTIGDEAEALEHAAMTGDFDFVKSNSPVFIKNLSRLIDDIGSAVAKTGVMSKPSKDKPDEALLKKFLSACESLDIDAMDAAMAKLCKWEYTSDGGLVSQLQLDLGRGKYNEIKDRLKEFFER